MAVNSLGALRQRIVACQECPRLASYLMGLKKDHPDWWCRPVPGWGDPKARLVVVGLAPAARGANRTGRMFTGDLSGGSGHWVYGILHELGLASLPDAVSADDGLRLKNAYITAAVRCAPPANQPTPKELEACQPYLEQELKLLNRVKVILALGQLAHTRVVKLLGGRPSEFPFAHGGVHRIGHYFLVDTYHPSRQNTFTRRLTYPMWRAVWKQAIRWAESRGRRP